MAACFGVGVSSFLASFQRSKNSWRVLVRSEDGADSVSAVVSGASLVGEKEGSWSSLEKGNGWLKSEASEKKKVKKRDNAAVKLEPSWDDGYGTVTVKDYFDAAKDFTQHSDGGPPRWFCPLESGSPLKGSPVLLFLPGMDGTGCGLIMHHKALGKAFEVRCLHIPVQDRTPFEGLVKLVEENIRSEHASSPKKPIYLVGDSFGGCLALAVASCNPKIDLVLILVNPATSFGRSQLQPLLPLLEAMPDVLHGTVPYLLSFVMGEPVKMATVDVESRLPPMQQLEKVSLNLAALLPYLSELSTIIPKDTLLWKLKLLKSAAAYANSRLHAVKAEVLVLASGKDNMVPSRVEAERLKQSLQNCTSRHFKENGHTLLLEDGIGLMTVIKSTYKYRRSRKHDAVSDYLPPSLTEFNFAFSQVTGLFHFLTGSTMFSTLGDGTIVKGLSGVPDEGPVLLVGYHNLLGLELSPLVKEFMREKNIVVRGIAHPELFLGNLESEYPEISLIDWVKVFGAVPVTGSNLYKLLSENSHVLLYPGGAREALHRKGEEYKLFWPDQQEFVRMAARFGATIVPFGAVGEDDLAQMILDYNDLIKIPMLNDHIRETTQNSAKVRDTDSGEVGNQDLFFPLLLPKIPGRLYYLFGKPIVTKGREEILKDKKKANQLYNEVKFEVERSLEYLIKKRKEDPYRSFIDRTVYKAVYASQHEVPTFEP
ncbi:acyltransferase-like protein At1g54570, chloroplastic [Momordica charantia]|uniref:Acyltransferase-like protein At1g54570, chloroplastic n=1 Tax=Momordica charantia TaxID=3673 RepID=A0A6J1CP33_MOMCH|nr:acyltransferase-like protein At1g54570, chloroplastic [Momordica charantia]XP_022143062.1 acyltransferase-like protein At1g54570, chloroplastic [Momordica charantia]